jgi:uncharacterized protein YajQ (UPF0234 family)
VSLMAKDSSFDVVSQIELHEVDNAIAQALKEIATRYDFKGSKSEIKRDDDHIILISDSEYKLESVVDVLQTKFIKRNIPLKAMSYGKIETASGGLVRQKVDLVQGIEQENAKKITTLIRDSKIKVQVQIQGDQLRISGKNRDDLQAAIQLIKEANLPIAVQFINYR